MFVLFSFLDIINKIDLSHWGNEDVTNNSWVSFLLKNFYELFLKVVKERLNITLT